MEQVIAIYLRLSQEDVDLRKNKAKDESNSIAAQRNIITRYLERNEALRQLPRLEFCDDGYTGTNFDRPSFQRMLDLAKSGNLCCIVVKDLSRFGRDYLEVGYYLEHIFPFLGIRFIAINDSYDSDCYTGRTGGMDIAFRNLVYDYYSKDLSIKVKTAMKLRQDKGQYVNCVPYGYKRDEKRKHHMVIDPPAAEIVREVFSAILAGQTTTQVAAELNRRHVPTPEQYKGVQRKKTAVPLWSRHRIVYMIHNIKYTGVMTNHTCESRYIRDKNQCTVPKEDWVVVEDAHEAIIPRADWERANEMLRKVRKAPRGSHDTSDRVYYCAHCGHKLQKTFGSDEYYSCASASYHPDSLCAGIRLRRTDMEDLLLSSLRVQVQFLEETSRTRKNESAEKGETLRQSIRKLDRTLEQIRQEKLSQYEQYRDGRIDRDAFLRCKDQAARQTESLLGEKHKLEVAYESFLSDQALQEAQDSSVEMGKKIVMETEEGLKKRLYEAVSRVIVTDNKTLEIQWIFPDFFTEYT